ncbi:MAG: hypothetical protein ABIJ86_09990 [Spirochaetota bacterium]
MRVMIDSNILDRLDDDAEARNELSNRRDILLLVTPAQVREVADIPDPAKRERLLGILARLCKRLAFPPLATPPLAFPPLAPTPALVRGTDAGLNPTDESSVRHEDTADDIIIATAVAAGCDLLVSDDIEVLNKALAASLRVMDWKLFLGRVVWIPRRRRKNS